MFAVVKTGGKQYKVSAGDVLKVERLVGDAGQEINLSSVLLINQDGNLSVGAPFLESAEIQATIVEQTRGDKIIVFKKKRRQGYRRTAGHRQDLTVIRIEDIIFQNKSFKLLKVEDKNLATSKKNVSKKDDMILANTPKVDPIKVDIGKKDKLEKPLEVQNQSIKVSDKADKETVAKPKKVIKKEDLSETFSSKKKTT